MWFAFVAHIILVLGSFGIRSYLLGLGSTASNRKLQNNTGLFKMAAKALTRITTFQPAGRRNRPLKIHRKQCYGH